MPPKFGVGDKVSYIPQYFHSAKDDFLMHLKCLAVSPRISTRAEVRPTTRRPFRVRNISQH
jgi:hypothetical protein